MNDTERAIEISGAAETLAEALDQWENEREALRELFDENQALAISFRQYDLTITLADKLINALELEAGMFIAQKTRDKIMQFREQVKELEARRAADRQNVIDANGRRSSRTQEKGGTCAICNEPAEAHHVEDGGHEFHP